MTEEMTSEVVKRKEHEKRGREGRGGRKGRKEGGGWGEGEGLMSRVERN